MSRTLPYYPTLVDPNSGAWGHPHAWGATVSAEVRTAIFAAYNSADAGDPWDALRFILGIRPARYLRAKALPGRWNIEEPRPRRRAASRVTVRPVRIGRMTNGRWIIARKEPPR